MGARVLLLLLLVLVFAGGMRLLPVGYLADDWIIMTHVYRHGNASSWTSPWLLTKGANFHRPLFTGLYALELELFGADPWWGHLHQLLWHMGAALLLFLLIRQLGGQASVAFLGALLFAWNPYHAVSLGWLASRTGTVAATLTLLSGVLYIFFVDRGGWSWFFLALLAAMGAALTKESGYLAFLTPPLAEFLLRRPRASRSQICLRLGPFLLAGSALLLLRYRALGTLLGGYGGADGLLAGGAVARRSLLAFLDAGGRLLEGLPPEYLRQLGNLPWPAWPLFAYLGALFTGIILCLGLKACWSKTACCPERGRRPGSLLFLLSLLGLQLLLLLLAAGPALSPLNCQRWYGVILLLSALLALLAGISRGRWPRLLLVGLLLLFAPASFEAQSFVRAGARFSKQVIEQVGKALLKLPPKRDAVFVTGLPENYRGLPLFWWGFEALFGPPFRRPLTSLPIYPVHRNLRLGPGFAWQEHPPVEALVRLSGLWPVELVVEREGDRVSVLAVDLARLATRKELLARLKEAFPGPLLPLRLAAGQPSRLQPDTGQLRLTVAAQGLKRVDFFIFVPGKDTRVRVPAPAHELRTDLWPYIRDVAFSRGELTRIFILAVGFPRAPRATPRLSRLLTLLCTPREPRSAWLRR